MKKKPKMRLVNPTSSHTFTTSQTSKDMIDSIPFIQVDRGGKNIRYQFTTYAKPNSTGGFNCYIPVYNIYFSAKNRDEIDERSTRLMNSFFNYNCGHKGYDAFYKKIYSMGFIAKTPAQNKALKRGSNKLRRVSLRASVAPIPQSYSESISKVMSGNVNMAA